MKKLILVVLVLNSIIVMATDYPAFVPISRTCQEIKSTAVEAPNMPKIRSQDGLPICHGFAAWTIFAQFKCSALNQGNADCKHLDPNKYPSPLYMACLLYTSPSPRDGLLSRMPSSA